MKYADVQKKVYFYTKTNVNSFSDADMVIAINNALERVTSLIEQADARWQFDDTNQTDLPIGTTTLTLDQQDYGISTAHLSITRVEVKNEQGTWIKLSPIDQVDLYNTSLTDFLSGSGDPQYYDKIGNSIFLYPKPDYTQSASLKVWFKRGPVAVTTATLTSTTVGPGFNGLYHELVPLYISQDYAMANGLPNFNQLATEIAKKEDALKEDYALRNKDEHITLRAHQSLSGRGFFR